MTFFCHNHLFWENPVFCSELTCCGTLVPSAVNYDYYKRKGVCGVLFRSHKWSHNLLQIVNTVQGGPLDSDLTRGYLSGRTGELTEGYLPWTGTGASPSRPSRDLTRGTPLCEQTDTSENITFPILRMRAVIRIRSRNWANLFYANHLHSTRKGNVFTGVCHSVQGRGGTLSGGGGGFVWLGLIYLEGGGVNPSGPYLWLLYTPPPHHQLGLVSLAGGGGGGCKGEYCQPIWTIVPPRHQRNAKKE